MSNWVGAVAAGAIALSWGIGGALTIAIVGAATEPMHASAKRALSRVCTWALKALSVALSVFVWVVKLPYGLAVTYFHTYRADRGSGRHFKGFGYRRQSAGRHRKAVWA